MLNHRMDMPHICCTMLIANFMNACVSLFCLGMKIATYANARTALEARKGIAPAFMCGKHFETNLA